ncbi:hypothetical protein [Pseudomonas phage HZ2201]|nr:hypothetical protein [Pseudomonas phage HZ2201]
MPLIRGIAPRVPQKSILSSGVFMEYPPRVPQANVGVALSPGVLAPRAPPGYHKASPGVNPLRYRSSDRP